MLPLAQTTGTGSLQLAGRLRGMVASADAKITLHLGYIDKKAIALHLGLIVDKTLEIIVLYIKFYYNNTARLHRQKI
jgi:hypothetical protein